MEGGGAALGGDALEFSVALDVRPGGILVGVIRRKPRGGEQTAGLLHAGAEAAPKFVDGLDVLDAGDRTRRVVVLQSLADAWQRVAHLDAERLQQLRRPDA